MDHLGHTRSLTIFKCSDFPCLSFSMSQISKELKKKIRKVNVKLISGEPGAHQRAETFKMFTFSLDLNFDIVKSQKWNKTLEGVKNFQNVTFSIDLKLKVKVKLKPGAHQRGWDSKSESGDPSSREAGRAAYQEYLRWGKYSWKLPVNRMGCC